MELIIQAGIVLIGQLGELMKLWLQAGKGGFSQEEIAREIERIMKQEIDQNAAEWSIVTE